jgi:long-chain acyl-CoA synthetase
VSSLSNRVRNVLAIDPESIAIKCPHESFTWNDISTAIESIESLLAGSNGTEGVAVGVIMRNRPASVAALAEAIVNERCLVTLSPMLSDLTLSNDIKGLGLYALLADPEDLARPGILDAAIEAGAMVIEMSSTRGLPVRMVQEGSAKREARHRRGVALEMLTSGTTGPPKRIPLTTENLEFSLAGDTKNVKTVDSKNLRLQSSPALIWHPLAHISGAYFIIDALYSGRIVVLLERFDAETWADLVKDERVRVGQLTPTAMRMILDANISPEKLSSLKAIRGGTSATSPELQMAFEDRFGVPVLTTYGATEFAGAIAGWTIEDHKAYGTTHRGASGRAHPGVELRVVNVESGDTMQIDTEGVLEARIATSSMKTSAWVRTSDLAMIDDEGFLWIRGRTDDVIIRGGFKLHADKIVSALEEHAEVKEAAIIGLTDDRLGAVPVGAVVLEAGSSLSVPELLSFARSRLASYEVPRDIVVVEELPRTPSMKVSRPALRELFANQSI